MIAIGTLLQQQTIKQKYMLFLNFVFLKRFSCLFTSVRNVFYINRSYSLYVPLLDSVSEDLLNHCLCRNIAKNRIKDERKPT